MIIEAYPDAFFAADGLPGALRHVWHQCPSVRGLRQEVAHAVPIRSIQVQSVITGHVLAVLACHALTHITFARSRSVCLTLRTCQLLTLLQLHEFACLNIRCTSRRSRTETAAGLSDAESIF